MAAGLLWNHDRCWSDCSGTAVGLLKIKWATKGLLWDCFGTALGLLFVTTCTMDRGDLSEQLADAQKKNSQHEHGDLHDWFDNSHRPHQHKVTHELITYKLITYMWCNYVTHTLGFSTGLTSQSTWLFSRLALQPSASGFSAGRGFSAGQRLLSRSAASQPVSGFSAGRLLSRSQATAFQPAI